MLTVADRSWLQELKLELYPPPPPDTRTEEEKRFDIIRKAFPYLAKGPRLPPPPKGREQMTSQEVIRFFEVVKRGKLVVEPFSYGFFGGIGVSIYDHEQYIGTGAEVILSIVDTQLPDPGPKSWHKKLVGKTYKTSGKIPGGIRDDAFDLFMKYSKGQTNLVWLSKYNLQQPRERMYYEY